MKRSTVLVIASMMGMCGSAALAQGAKETTKPAAKPAATQPAEPQLPAGWTAEDMQACMEAGTPGAQHAFLAEGVGTWTGTSTMWMAPGTEPMTSEMTSTVSAIMDGRYIKVEITGEIPGMGPFQGFGLHGFDNVAQTFQASWIDNCSTGMMFGTGELSSDGKTLTWNYTYHCPITKKPTHFREVERRIGKDAVVFEMFGVDPKSGKEFKMMELNLKRTPGTASATSAR